MNYGINFHITENYVVYGEWNGIKIYVRNDSDAMSLLRFASNTHNFSILDNLRNVAVIDIGAYVGVSTCYFSRHPAVSKVYSYEPFEDYVQLLLNLTLNPEVLDKSIVKNAGISDQTQEETLPYYPNARWISGVKASLAPEVIANSASFHDCSSVYETVCTFEDVKNIEPVLTTTENPVIVFIDAKGFEEKILNRMFSSMNITQLRAVIGVFYYDFNIERMFCENGFDFYYHPDTSAIYLKKFGAFHAIRR
jgi:FkbM family methyltransferase